MLVGKVVVDMDPPGTTTLHVEASMTYLDKAATLSTTNFSFTKEHSFPTPFGAKTRSLR
jgi:hypothetical protein